MNIIDVLKADHHRVADLFEKLEQTTEQAEKTRAELFDKLKEELELHAAFEETHFYPPLKEEQESEDLTREAYEEHRVVKTLLKELDALDKTDPQWIAKLTVLKENVQHHVEEEEKELFPLAQEIYTDEELEDLGAQATANRKEVMAR